MYIASIDIGTNTILLLIANVNLSTKEIIAAEDFYEMPRIGKDLKPGGYINSQSIDRMFEVLSSYENIISKNKCEKIIVNGTNALRIASNSEEIKKLVKNKFGYSINILSGETEAQYSFLGAYSTLPGKSDRLVVDVGGGSTKIILGNYNEIKFRRSYQIGAVNLTEEIIRNNPPVPSEIQLIQNKINHTLGNLTSNLTSNIPSESDLIAVAGTPTTLSCINQGLTSYNEEKVEGSILSYSELEIIINRISKMKSQVIRQTFGEVVKGREDVILAGSIIFYQIMNILKLEKMYVSGKGIRYGAVIDYMKNI